MGPSSYTATAYDVAHSYIYLHTSIYSTSFRLSQANLQYSSSKSKTNGGFELLSHSLEGSAIYKKASVLDGGGLQLTLYAASLTALTIRKIVKNVWYKNKKKTVKAKMSVYFFLNFSIF